MRALGRVENAIDMAHIHYLHNLTVCCCSCCHRCCCCLQGEIEFECGHWGVFENAIDMAHIHYLHGDSFGNSEKPRIHDMTTTRDTFHVEAQFRCVWGFAAKQAVRRCGVVLVYAW